MSRYTIVERLNGNKLAVDATSLARQSDFNFLERTIHALADKTRQFRALKYREMICRCIVTSCIDIQYIHPSLLRKNVVGVLRFIIPDTWIL